jgi:membrane-associated phospholipid phosphatase
MSAEMKDYLWAIYSGDFEAPGGISAMPSMHNAQAMLFAAAAWRVDRRFGLAMWVFAAIIFVGSIHLGWHYAVDGIVGAAAALLVWKACGSYIRAGRRATPAPHPVS